MGGCMSIYIEQFQGRSQASLRVMLSKMLKKKTQFPVDSGFQLRFLICEEVTTLWTPKNVSTTCVSEDTCQNSAVENEK